MLLAPASHASLKRTAAPGIELYTSADAAVLQHLHLDAVPSDSAYLDLVLASAREQVEQECGLALITQTWQAAWDAVPCSPRDGTRYRSLSLGRAPLLALSSCSYLDEDGATQTFTLSGQLLAANVGLKDCYGRAVLAPDVDWPDLGAYPEALKIVFTAGYGTAATNVPENARLAVLFLAAWWYQERLPVNVGNIVNQLPMHLQRMLNQIRVLG